MNSNQFITIGLVAIFFIAISIFFIDKGLFGIKGDDHDEEDLEEEDAEEESSSIFYLYNHRSERDWLNWINKQVDETKQKAAHLLKGHLEGPTKKWGYVTLEVLECIKGFKSAGLDQAVVNFFEQCSKSWNEYKSIPNYYYKAAEVLIAINPAMALHAFKIEISKKGNSQGGLERRRAIIDSLPELGKASKDLVVEILTSSTETYGTKVYALRKCEKFSAQIKSHIHLEAFKRIVDKYKNSRQEMQSEETHFVQDLIEECVRNIGQIEFFKVLNEASHSDRFHRFVIKQVLKVLSHPKNIPNNYDLFAMCNLKDDFQHDVKRAIGKIHNLDPVEINNIVLQPTTKNISKNELVYGDNSKMTLPIPTVYNEEYLDYQSIFFQNIDEHDYVTSEKIYGGVLITGDEPIEKLYFARALAKEKEWNFACIDISKINGKQSYDAACDVYNKLRKPYLLYIINPQVLFERDSSEESILREKFVQMLTIQSLDTKSFLAGDILATNEQIANSSISDKLSTLRSKFFPQSLEMNKKADRFKMVILDQYLKHISTKRSENRKEMCDQILENGKHMSPIEFCFYVLKNLKIMLLIYGKDCNIREIERLETTFYNPNVINDEDSEEIEDDNVTVMAKTSSES